MEFQNCMSLWKFSNSRKKFGILSIFLTGSKCRDKILSFAPREKVKVQGKYWKVLIIWKPGPRAENNLILQNWIENTTKRFMNIQISVIFSYIWKTHVPNTNPHFFLPWLCSLLGKLTQLIHKIISTIAFKAQRQIKLCLGKCILLYNVRHFMR